jgi:hypothetical protein
MKAEIVLPLYGSRTAWYLFVSLYCALRAPGAD